MEITEELTAVRQAATGYKSVIGDLQEILLAALDEGQTEEEETKRLDLLLRVYHRGKNKGEKDGRNERPSYG